MGSGGCVFRNRDLYIGLENREWSREFRKGMAYEGLGSRPPVENKQPIFKSISQISILNSEI